MIRIINIILSLLVLIITSPLILLIYFILYLIEKQQVLYKPIRIGLNGVEFKMYKFRSMVINADKSKIDSTKDDDERITPIGKLIRKYKIDELPQFFNVLKGDMNIIGPRPNIGREVNMYTIEERKILSVKPGITDLSSIVFSDLGQILIDSKDPNIAYNQLVRPWKSKLCLFYVNNRSLILDMIIFALTIISLMQRKLSLQCICKLLRIYEQDEDLIKFCARKDKLIPMATVGADAIVYERDI